MFFQFFAKYTWEYSDGPIGLTALQPISSRKAVSPVTDLFPVSFLEVIHIEYWKFSKLCQKVMSLIAICIQVEWSSFQWSWVGLRNDVHPPKKKTPTKKKLLWAAPLFTRGRHSGGIFDLADIPMPNALPDATLFGTLVSFWSWTGDLAHKWWEPVISGILGKSQSYLILEMSHDRRILTGI